MPEVIVNCLSGQQFSIDVGEDDTIDVLRQLIATKWSEPILARNVCVLGPEGDVRRGSSLINASEVSAVVSLQLPLDRDWNSHSDLIQTLPQDVHLVFVGDGREIAGKQGGVGTLATVSCTKLWQLSRLELQGRVGIAVDREDGTVFFNNCEYPWKDSSGTVAMMSLSDASCYYDSASVVLILFSLANRTWDQTTGKSSFENIPKWRKEARDVPVAMAREIGALDYLECSALSGAGVIFSPTILLKVFGEMESLSMLAVQAAAMIMVTIIGNTGSLAVVPCIGAKALNTTGLALCCFAFAAFASVYQYWHDQHTLQFCLLCTVNLALSLPNIATFMLPVLLFPRSVRSTFHGISAAAAKIGALVGTILFPALEGYGIPTIMFTQAVLCGLGAACSHWFLDESDVDYVKVEMSTEQVQFQLVQTIGTLSPNALSEEHSVDDEDLRNRQLEDLEDVKGQNTRKVDEEQACEVSSSSTSPTASPKTSVPAKKG
eukprot:s2330_g10.t1